MEIYIDDETKLTLHVCIFTNKFYSELFIIPIDEISLN
jgi:hypothetical protein